MTLACELDKPIIVAADDADGADEDDEEGGDDLGQNGAGAVEKEEEFDLDDFDDDFDDDFEGEPDEDLERFERELEGDNLTETSDDADEDFEDEDD